MGRCSEKQLSAPRHSSGREKMTSCLMVLPPCYPNHEGLYLKTMSPNKHFSSKFLGQLLCHNRKKCYISLSAIMLSVRLKPRSTGWFFSEIQRQWHTCTQVLKAERDESPTRYFRALGNRQDIRVIWQISLYPCQWVYSRSTEKNARQSSSKTSCRGPSTESWA